jgi:hypothetical protein
MALRVNYRVILNALVMLSQNVTDLDAAGAHLIAGDFADRSLH